ncbi:protein disulfide isomerase, putative [Leishmania tarentolae]|uniref:Protein disulfide isomerase, putative n=1 Tax=Leishmania tarentolae TaxID=5689 RepID=A0A640KK28_LEITA|nr:protein disulfide isomerase, putative [Leishmania tarentolae]
MTPSRSLLLTLVLMVFRLAGLCSSEHPGAGMRCVLQMNKDNFDWVAGKDKSTPVKLYASWCAHCTRLTSEYVALGAADELRAYDKALLQSRLNTSRAETWRTSSPSSTGTPASTAITDGDLPWDYGLIAEVSETVARVATSSCKSFAM